MRLITASSAMPVRTAWRIHSRLGTGSIPGIAASTRLTCVLGSAPNAVAAPENSFDLVAVIWAWTSHSPVSPAIRYSELMVGIPAENHVRRNHHSERADPADEDRDQHREVE